MSNSTQLSLEQQFSLRCFETQVKHLNQDQAQVFLVELYRHMMVKDNLFRQLIKQEWFK